jgi:heptosyltransferase-2
VSGSSFPRYRLLLTAYRLPKYLPAVHDAPDSPNVLAVRFSSIGDVLLTTPLLRAIRHRHPGSRITVLTKDRFTPLLSHNPHITQVIGVPAERTLTSTAAELRARRFTHLLDLHDSVRSRMLRALIPGWWGTYPKHRIARTVLIHTKRDYYRDRRPVAERYFTAARDLDVRPDGSPPELFLARELEAEAADWLANANLAPNRRLVAIAPGAAHATKRWPLHHWQTLVGRVVGEGFNAAFVGSSEDTALGSTLSDGLRGRVVNAAGRFGLQGTGALLQRAATLVSGDTGVMHMATAVGTPVVALFGPTVRAFGFFPYTARAHVVELALGCRPCSSKGGPRCPLTHHRCMVDMGPETVFEALRRSIS